MRCRLGIFAEIFLASGHVPVTRHAFSALAIEGLVIGLKSVEAVDVAVVHAKGRRDKHRVVNLDVSRAELARSVNVGRWSQVFRPAALCPQRPEGL